MPQLLIPFRRDLKRDFASGAGLDLLRSKIRQVLLTTGDSSGSTGELAWRTDFGAGLDLFRHRASDEALAELARVRIRDALRQWVPEVEVTRVEARSTESRLDLTVWVRPRFAEAWRLRDTGTEATMRAGIALQFTLPRRSEDSTSTLD